MKYYIIAGEASGDLHASNLVRELGKLDNDAVIRGWGGDLMQAQGVELVKHYKDLAFMGFTEVLLNLRTILNNLKFCKDDIRHFAPDVLILVDYPGFNLRIADFASKIGIKVFYYISPQVWAWKQSRVRKIKRCITRMFVILPFEKDFYAKYQYEVDFVGHPLLDAIENTDNKSSGEDFRRKYHLDQRPVIAILPGSRKQEISRILPVMLSIIPYYKDFQFVVAGTTVVPETFYRQFITNGNIKLLYQATYDILRNSSAALVTSGTATLETALFGVPEVVCYKGGYLSYQLARRFIRVRYISLVNLIMNKEVVKELIQQDLNPENLKKELDLLLFDEACRNKITTELKNLKEKLGVKGASAQTAKLMYNNLIN